MTDEQIQIPFAGSPDETTDPRFLPPGSVISVKNANFDLDGSYQPRLGYKQLGAGSSGYLARLQASRNELLLIDGANVNGYDPVADKFVTLDAVNPLAVTHAPLQNATTNYASWAEASANGYRVVAWIDGIDGQPRATVYSQTTGTVVVPPKVLVHTAGNIHDNVFAFVCGTSCIVTVSDRTAGNIYGFTIALSPLGSWSAAQQLNTGGADYLGASTGTYCACTLGSGYFAICYEITGSKIRVRTWTSTPSIFNSQDFSCGIAGLTAMGCNGSSADLVWIGYTNGTAGSVRLAAITASTAVLADGPFTTAITLGATSYVSRIGILRLSSTSCMFCAEYGANYNSNTAYANLYYIQYNTSGALSTLNVCYNAGLASAPVAVTVNGASRVVCFARMPYLNTLAASTFGTAGLVGQLQQGSYFLVDLNLGTLTANTPQLLGVYAPTIVTSTLDGTIQKNVPSLVTGVAAGSLETVLPLSRSGSNVGLDLFTVALTASWQWSPANLGTEHYMAGQVYDGSRVVELGFPIPPVIQSATKGSAGTNAYQYIATFCRVNVNGNLEESAPSSVVEVDAAATPFTSPATLVVTTLCLTSKQRYSDLLGGIPAGPASPVYIRIYRTPALASGDTNFYLVSQFNINYENLLTAATISITDSVADAAAQVSQVLYTISGELPHNAPESLTAIVAHKDRVWGIGADKRTIWFSQTYTAGVMPSWSNLNQVTLDDTQEQLTALATLYDKLLVFTPTRIYVLYGDGPSVAGTGSDLTQPQQVPMTTGCIDPRSIVNSPNGIWYYSQRGLEFVGPDLVGTFAGRAISVTTGPGQALTCTGAAMCENSSTMRWCFTSAEGNPNTGTGLLAVFDMRRERWTLHYPTCGGARGNVAGAPMQACVYHPVYGFVAGHNDSSTGVSVVYRENSIISDTNPWLDLGTYFVPIAVQTAWIKAADLQGWHRVRRIRLLNQYYAPHGLNVTLNYDYATQNELHSWTDTIVSGFVVGSREQVRIVPGQGKGEAISLTIATVAPTVGAVGTGQGAALTGLAFEVRKSKGGYRVIGDSAKS